MKKLNLVLITGIIALNLFSWENVFSQEITRGPDIGEIYFKGPTTTVLYDAIYHSTDFGETAVCVDSVSTLTNFIVSITADKTPGGLYYTTMGEALYYSPNYGQYGSWEFRHGGIGSRLSSGINEGYIFEGAASHSEDFGFNFINHSGIGAFGSMKASDIGYNNKGYLLTSKYLVQDSIFLFLSYDNFDTYQLINKFNYMNANTFQLSYGYDPNSLFLYNFHKNELLFSNDDGLNWTLKNTFTSPFLPIKGISGGRQAGELYMLVIYIQCPAVSSDDDHNKHIYIYHSLDYGETFTVYHPFSCGDRAHYANFEASPLSGNAPLTVQFNDLSVGAESWEWDFQNDGIIDSYEPNPVYTYEEEGSYTPWLIINNVPTNENNAFREDYITISSGNSQEIDLTSGYQFISSNRLPETPDMLEVLGNNLNDNLGFVRNSQGQTLLNIGGNWVNNIGDWISTEGYLFKMNEADVLIIDGTIVNPQTPINLNIGYQFISYFPNETLDALEVFAGILNDDLDFIRNSEGSVLRKIGPNWVNGIGDCESGEGFLVKMNGEGELVYP